MGFARPRTRRFLRVGAVVVAAFVLMIAFETAKEAFAPAGLTRWQSHWITITFAAAVAAAASWAIARAQAEEEAARLRAEAEHRALARCLTELGGPRETLSGGRVLE